MPSMVNAVAMTTVSTPLDLAEFRGAQLVGRQQLFAWP